MNLSGHSPNCYFKCFGDVAEIFIKQICNFVIIRDNSIFFNKNDFSEALYLFERYGLHFSHNAVFEFVELTFW